MQGWNSLRALHVLGWIAAGLYLTVGVSELILADDAEGRLLFLAALAALAACVLGGIRLVPHRPWPGFALASVGATLGGFVLFWTLLAIPLALAIVGLGAASARRPSSAPADPRSS
jgi:hypothetical protein